MTSLPIAADDTPAFQQPRVARLKAGDEDAARDVLQDAFLSDGHHPEPVTSWAETGDRLLERDHAAAGDAERRRRGGVIAAGPA